MGQRHFQDWYLSQQKNFCNLMKPTFFNSKAKLSSSRFLRFSPQKELITTGTGVKRKIIEPMLRHQPNDLYGCPVILNRLMWEGERQSRKNHLGRCCGANPHGLTGNSLKTSVLVRWSPCCLLYDGQGIETSRRYWENRIMNMMVLKSERYTYVTIDCILVS